ncbi:MAG TPA: DUF58 domain-containing protein [Thermoanaerobaculia bacterium]|jgi:uncharacterized protein (DUF58 family)|nr:DUF58 domain-containing protein [Thermoanaerobaculia bacterium]
MKPVKRGFFSRRAVPEGIRITTVGLWYVLFTVLVAIAATNTGNNALYMVLALMFSVLILSGVASRQNVRGLEAKLDPPGEVFANRPFAVGFTLKSRALVFPRWFLLFTLSRSAQPLLIPWLPRRGKSAGQIEMLVGARGFHRFPFAHVSSLFPFGFFRKGVRYRVDFEVLVFPELFPAGGSHPQDAEHAGDDASRRTGWGHDLHALRLFRRGDDPRGIHWKQTARTGEMIFTERASERNRRLSILFDNGVGELRDPAEQSRFERLVSEAATIAVDHLARGYEVELVTRDQTLGFAGGPRQRLAVLEALALVEPRPRGGEPLASGDPRAPHLRVHMDADSAARLAG